MLEKNTCPDRPVGDIPPNRHLEIDSCSAETPPRSWKRKGKRPYPAPGGSLINLLEDWGFTDTNVKRLRGILEATCKEPERNPEAARGSLRSIMHEV